jgi:MFS transporter, DHA2 family, multidrug resistance protein
LIGAIAAELNDQVTSIALVDARGAVGNSYDPGSWIQSLYSSAQIVGFVLSPWQLVTFTLRRWTLFSIALCGVSSVPIPFSPNIEAIYALRLLQGLSSGLLTPLLMVTALRALDPKHRLYGLALCALTSTFTPGVAAALAALWTDVAVDWRFVFFQAVPLCTVAGLLVWYGDPQDEPHYERFHMLNWRGILLVAVGFGSLSTRLYQGDRLDWFNSPLICVLALVSVVAIPLFVLNEWFQSVPFLDHGPGQHDDLANVCAGLAAINTEHGGWDCNYGWVDGPTAAEQANSWYRFALMQHIANHRWN